MSQAEELLNGMSEEIPVHTHPVPDTDTYFVIDPVTRKIENTNPKKHVIMQYDHNSERCTFELPRFIDGHDMLECTSVTVNVDNIEVVEFEGAEEAEPVEPRINSDAPDMTDLRIHPNDPEKVISSWLISRNSTQLAGILSFHIEYKCVDSNGNVVYEWSTDNYDEYEIRARKKNGEAVIAPHIDTLEQWRTRIFGAGDSVMANIEAEGEAQVAAVKAESETQQEAVELKGAQTLDSIPEDYTKVDAMAEEAIRSKGDAIVCEASGESIVLTDSSDDYIRGLKVFGKGSQVTTKGYQLFDASIIPTVSKGGATITNNGDGSFTVSGSGTLTEDIAVLKDYTHEESIRMLKLGMLRCLLTQTKPYCYIQIRNNSEIYFGLTHSRQSYEITQATLDDPNMHIRLGFYGAANEEIVPGVVKPMLYQDGDGTWEPFSGGYASPSPEWPQEIASIENPTIRTYGSNLFDMDSFIANAHDKGAQHYVKLVDGDLQINTLAYMENYTAFDFGFKSLTPYTLSFKPVWVDRSSDDVRFSIKFTYDDGSETVYTILYSDGERVRYFKSSGDKNLASIAIGRWAQNGTCKLLNVHLAEGSFTADDMPAYEPYSGGILTLNSTLPGIPVTSGGNYTDADGQQWICDEINLERGVYVQRVGIKDFDGSDDEDWGGVSEVTDNMRSWITVQGACRPESDTANGIMCSQFMPQVSMNKGAFYQNRDRFFFGSGMTLNEWKTHLQSKPLQLVYVPSTPIEIPLTAEEISAFKALRTNYPNTTILNDAGAWMSVKYNADTKSYVDNPKTLKLVDSSTGVVYELKIVDGNITVVPV
jgi:hypothetical protein